MTDAVSTPAAPAAPSANDRVQTTAETVAPSAAPAPEEAVAQSSATASAPSDAPSDSGSADGAKEPSLAKRFEAAKTAEMRARKAGERELAKVQAERSTLEKERQEHAAAVAQHQAERQQATKAQKELDAALADPIAWALSRVPAEEIGPRIASYGSPEAHEVRKLRAELEADKKARAEEAERAANETKTAAEKRAAESKERARHEAMVSFVAEITPEECPNLVKAYEPEVVPALVQAALKKHGPAFREVHGRNPTNAEIRAFLEESARQRLNPQVTQSASNGAPQAAPGTGHQQTNGPGTLTNNHASQAATSASVEMTKEQRKKRLTARLEAETPRRG